MSAPLDLLSRAERGLLCPARPPTGVAAMTAALTSERHSTSPDWIFERKLAGQDPPRRGARPGLGGLIARRADRPYAGGRSRDWLKLKCEHGQELVIGGHTAPRGSREHPGALLVGHSDGDRLRYAGKVGTGFDRATLADLADGLVRHPRFLGLRQDKAAAEVVRER